MLKQGLMYYCVAYQRKPPV